MVKVRQKFQGVGNIVRFNWHFFLLAFLVVLGLGIVYFFVSGGLKILVLMGILGVIVFTVVPLVVSWYVYDGSDLYDMKWLDKLEIFSPEKVVNIHAGFDEISLFLSSKFPEAELAAFDFYNPKKHTEVSIKRARALYPAYKDTISISTETIPLLDNTTDLIIGFLAFHEIRKDKEKQQFFSEIKRVLKSNGLVIIVEHLRDFPNFLAYNLGAFHFFESKVWQDSFQKSGFKIVKKNKTYSFYHHLSTSILWRHNLSLLVFY